MTYLVIKGALYFVEDRILRPHFTGEFTMVDCTQYLTMKEIKANYSKDFADGIKKKGFYILHDGIKYYECEYSPYSTDDNWDLLSDLSEIEYFDYECEF